MKCLFVADESFGSLPPADDNPWCRRTDRARLRRRNRRSVAHAPIAGRRRLSGPRSKTLSIREVDYVGGSSKCGDRRVRTLLYEAANVMLTRYNGQLKLKEGHSQSRGRSSMCRACIALARRLAIIMHAMLRTEPSSSQRRPKDHGDGDRKERRPREGADDGADPFVIATCRGLRNYHLICLS